MTMTMPGDSKNAAAEAEALFQEKMKERMRTAMGDLMPDEVLAGIVARGIEEAFFKKRTKSNGYGYPTVEYDSWIVEHLTQVAEAEVRKQVTQWIASNSEKITATVEGVLHDGIGAAVVRSLNMLFSNSFSNFSVEIMQRLEAIRTGAQR
jgi:hypothetical protein